LGKDASVKLFLIKKEQPRIWYTACNSSLGIKKVKATDWTSWVWLYAEDFFTFSPHYYAENCSGTTQYPIQQVQEALFSKKKKYNRCVKLVFWRFNFRWRFTSSPPVRLLCP